MDQAPDIKASFLKFSNDYPQPLEPRVATHPYLPTKSPFTASQSPYPNEKPNIPVTPRQNIYFQTRRKNKEEIESSWLTWLPIIGIILGFGCTGALVWDGIRQNKLPEYCEILNEDFSSGFNQKIWTKEAEVGGYGNGQFEETTTTDEKVFIRDGMPVMRPSLQDESLIYRDNIISLTEAGTCTADGQPWNSCVTSTNTTSGTIVNPVKSGRVNSKKGATIRYGTLPRVLFLDLPRLTPNMKGRSRSPGPLRRLTPLSSEMNICESRGNNYSYSMGGDDIVSSALHWGPDFASDMWWRTNARKEALHTTFSKGWHTYGLV
ncbi:uncharacterized protein HMPREF1541_10156 [Cyphellophora europaea CBS 101466]|uniref:GH16 domain-containing protein n=1 Tax=Cyphellophora europaea (strain CBS 101466) TaxID=1220924 RepID=W2S702_CYPE1|nr:uncharacterized protein HMPREF1541_10156 [Cyphellophora europaea CBS 101466]ETN44486.1 hypothetical protein HMPREF1541_10156 [Cyphellophora europaea CBS 101466]